MALLQLESQSVELTREVDALARARDASQEDYKAGAIALTDVLDADRDLLVARDDLAQTHADTVRAKRATSTERGPLGEEDRCHQQQAQFLTVRTAT